MSSAAKKTLLLALGLVLVAGCGDPLKDGQLLEEIRPLGVRIEGENGFSTAASGEEAELQLLFAGPLGPTSLRVALEICVAQDTAHGVPLCAEEPWFESTLDIVDSEGPVLVTIPDDVAPGSHLGIRAVACEEGEPELAPDPLDWRCSGDSDPIQLGFDAWTSGEDYENANPDLSGARVLIGDADAVLEPVSAAPACSGEVPEVSAGKEHDVVLILPDEAREAIRDDEVESLQISHFSTGGLLDRQFSVVDSSEGLSLPLTWEAPEEPGPVKQYAVVRDGRGGVSWLSYSVCVR